MYYSFSFLSKIFILIDSCHEPLSPEGTLRGYFFSSLGSMGWGRGSSPLPGGGIKETLSVGNLNINNKWNKIVPLFIITTCQESGDSQSIIKGSSLPRQTAPTDLQPRVSHCTAQTPAHAEGTAPREATQSPRVHLFSSHYHIVSVLANIIRTKNKTKTPHQCLSPKKILISQAQIGFELRPPVSDASLARPQAYQEQSSLILSSWAVWHVLGGTNTEGSLIPSVMSKNRVDNITL